MPLPKPTKEEDRNKFISRCISFAVGDGMPQNQAIAACHDIWRRAKGIKRQLSFSLEEIESESELVENAISAMEEK